MERILGKYKITYQENGFVQYKYLVSRGDWDNVLKPIKYAIDIIEESSRGKETEASRLLKQSLKVMFINTSICFPEGSPLHESIKTGVLSLPAPQGGDHKVSWEKIENN